jgi:hypothetical protein
MDNDHSLENSRERLAELKEFENMDREAVEYIGKEFRDPAHPERPLVSSETLEKMKDLPSQFQTHEELAQAYSKETGKPAPEGLEGFTKGLEMPAQICSEHRQTINETIIHERLHQASDPDATSLLGHNLSEGVTQALTEKMQEGFSSGRFYSGETRTAKKLMNDAGDSAVEKFYFQNDARELKDALARDAQYDSRMEQFKRLKQKG